MAAIALAEHGIGFALPVGTLVAFAAELAAGMAAAILPAREGLEAERARRAPARVAPPKLGAAALSGF